MSSEKVVIVGAGLCGTLLAVRLAQKGFQVELHEKRADMRKVEMVAGRSINLALSNRGIKALGMIGMDAFMLNEAIPMHGRMVHSLDGSLMLQPYSGRQGEYINSISRGGLNIGLLNKAEEYPNIKIYFESDCLGANLQKGTCSFKQADGTVKEIIGDLFIGTDGAGSSLRNTMFVNGANIRFSFSQQFLEAGYKELHIPSGENNSFLIEKNALHIWPRGGFMMIGLPNLDGSFTMTLFTDFKGENGFDNLHTPKDVDAYFTRHFPDAKKLMPNLAENFFQNPTGSLGTVKCYPWQYNGKFLLMGDAAHAVVPFYGQGMNCSFEDCVVFDKCIDEYGTDWTKVCESFQEKRKVDTDAIADLAVYNYYEMRDLVADPVFIKKRKLETMLEQTFPDYFSKYSMVTFRDDLPYSYAKQKGDQQNEVLMGICSKVDDVSKLNLKEVMEALS